MKVWNCYGDVVQKCREVQALGEGATCYVVVGYQQPPHKAFPLSSLIFWKPPLPFLSSYVALLNSGRVRLECGSFLLAL